MNDMNIVVESITDHDDGSATVVFNMSNEAMKIFANIGILKVLVDSATKAIDEYGVNVDE